MKTKLTITIDMDNAAFGKTEYDHAFEVARILKSYARVITDGYDLEQNLKDHNGNHVGCAELS